MKRLLAVAVLVGMCGCKHPGANGKIYTDTPQGRTAKYVHEHCYKVEHFDAQTEWNYQLGDVVTEKAFIVYRCPYLTNKVFIGDDEEQP